MACGSVKTVMVRFSVCSLARFLSHLEMVRVFERALRRISLPMSYSEGFNPRAKISLPLPRSVGMSADNEVLCLQVDTGGGFDVSVFEQDFQSHLPEGLEVKGVCATGRNERPRAVSMELVFDLGLVAEAVIKEGLARLERAAGGESLVVRRTYGPKKPSKDVDIGQYIYSVEFGEGELIVGCEITGGGTVRASEILEVLGCSDMAMEASVSRRGVQWLMKDGREPAFLN